MPHDPEPKDPASYRALLLDLDGTLIGPTGLPHPRTKAALESLVAGGVTVMIATGRSEGGTIPILKHLGFGNPALVYNGAGIWCPQRERLVEERTLADRTIDGVFDFARSRDLPLVAMRAGQKFCREPRSEGEARCLRGLEDLFIVPEAEIPRERLMRITIYSDTYTDSMDMLKDLDAAVARPVYYTNFPLNALYEHAGSSFQVVDVQPPCRGKGEALRYLLETAGIAAHEVVAVGDATNDIPMFEAAGLAVAMRDAMPAAIEFADRVIGGAETDTIAELVEELFPACFESKRASGF
ncbi:MAG: HAD family phosphatase [Planctomycetes bacterium]|nr:HAD family phosphatase [Planctomycetota bacterium]